MTEIINTPTSATVLALATTVHLAIMLLLWHRRGPRGLSLVLPSLVGAAAPWAFPTALGLAVGFGLHLAWFHACERLLPAQTAAAGSPARAAAAGQPAPVAAPSPRPARGFVPVPVIAVLRETDSITTFRVARPEGFEFKPGQFLTVRVSVDGEHVARCYSISSPPHASGFLEISVRRQGLVSGMLHATVRPGSTLDVMAPAGTFTYPAGDQRPLVFLAGGVGITPLISMLRHAVYAEPMRPVTLVYSVLVYRDVAFRDELRWLARRYPQARVIVAATEGPRDADCLSGRIDRRMLEEHVPDLLNSIFMICGPGPMMEAMKKILSELGVPPAQIRYEAFDMAVAMASKAAAAATVLPPAAAGAFKLRLVSSGSTVSAAASKTLLETCEAAGSNLQSACRAGVCGTCRIRLLEGNVRCESDLLDESERSEGYILPCVSWPESDCVLEA